MGSFAPIALFVGADPDRAAATLESLRRCDLADRSRLIVFCDGADPAADAEGSDRVRNALRGTTGFDDVEIAVSDRHLGRSQLVLDGVSDVTERFGRVIVVDDELIVASGFLRFMNDALRRYADDERVISICGFAYRLAEVPAETYFLPGAHCWGWATWQRGWQCLRRDPIGLVDDLVRQGLVYDFDGGGAEPLTRTLQEQAMEQQASWSLCWMASAVLLRKLTLYPGRSLVTNVIYSSPDAGAAGVFASPLAEGRVPVGEINVEPAADVQRELKAALIAWRARRSLAFRLYSVLARLMPDRLERAVYSALIHAKIRRAAAGPDQGLGSSRENTSDIERISGK